MYEELLALVRGESNQDTSNVDTEADTDNEKKSEPSSAKVKRKGWSNEPNDLNEKIDKISQ